MRIDQYLWCIRLFKSRNIASNACKKGQILINEQKVKDRMEISNSEFYNNVIEGFNELSKLKRFKTIDGSQTIDEIHKNIIKEIENKLIFKEG